MRPPAETKKRTIEHEGTETTEWARPLSYLRFLLFHFLCVFLVLRGLSDEEFCPKNKNSWICKTEPLDGLFGGTFVDYDYEARKGRKLFTFRLIPRDHRISGHNKAEISV